MLADHHYPASPTRQHAPALSKDYPLYANTRSNSTIKQ